MAFLRTRAHQVAAYFFFPATWGRDVRMTPETHPDQYVNPDGVGEQEARERRRAAEAARLSTTLGRRRRTVLGLGFTAVGATMLAFGSIGVPFVLFGLFSLGEVAWSVFGDRRNRRAADAGP